MVELVTTEGVFLPLAEYNKLVEATRHPECGHFRKSIRVECCICDGCNVVLAHWDKSKIGKPWDGIEWDQRSTNSGGFEHG